MVLVVEHRLEADGAAGSVDLIVDHRQGTIRQRFPAVGRERGHFQRLLCLRFVDGGQLVFGRRENHGDRLDLRDGDDAGLRRGIDDVADIDQTQAGDARDRRLDGSVVELGLRIEDGGVVGRDLRGKLRHGGALGVGLLPGGELAEFNEALQIEIGVGEIGLVLLLLRFGLVERGLERPGIDLDKQVALFHQVTFLEGDVVDLAIDPGAHHDGVKALHGAEPAQPHRKIRFCDRGDGDGNGGISRRRLLGGVSLRRPIRAVKSLPAESARCNQHGGQQNPTHRP